jgi:hypothetical protein
MMKKLALLTLDEAVRQTVTPDQSHGFGSAFEHKVTSRPPAPSPARLPSRTREYVLPPPLLPGPFSIILS